MAAEIFSLIWVTGVDRSVCLLKLRSTDLAHQILTFSTALLLFTNAHNAHWQLWQRYKNQSVGFCSTLKLQSQTTRFCFAKERQLVMLEYTHRTDKNISSQDWIVWLFERPPQCINVVFFKGLESWGELLTNVSLAVAANSPSYYYIWELPTIKQPSS